MIGLRENTCSCSKLNLSMFLREVFNPFQIFYPDILLLQRVNWKYYWKNALEIQGDIKRCQKRKSLISANSLIWTYCLIGVVGFSMWFNSPAITGKEGQHLKVKGGKRDPTGSGTPTFPPSSQAKQAWRKANIELSLSFISLIFLSIAGNMPCMFLSTSP